MVARLSEPNDWAVSYNTQDFRVETEPVNINTRPVYDRAGRTVSHVVHTFTLKTVITSLNPAAETTDANTSEKVAAIRQKLTQPAGTFTLSGVGWYDTVVNAAGGGGVVDVMWGPKPTSLSWRQAGAKHAWELTWQVEVAMLDQCATARYRGAVMEFNYRLAWERDRGGYTTRTYSGYLKIPQTRLSQGDRTIRDNADAYLESALPPTIPGFRRETKTATIDESKCQLDFTVQDTELRGYAPPPDCVISDVRRSLTVEGPAFVKARETVRGRYEMAKGIPKSRAYNLFHALILDTVKNTRDVQARMRGKTSCIPLSLQVNGGDVHGADAGDFAFTYSFAIPQEELGKLIQCAGIWNPPPGSNDPAGWQQSMARELVTTPRGYARLAFSNSDDKIIDLCNPGNPVPTRAAAGGDGGRGRRIDVDATGEDRGDRGGPQPFNPFNMALPDPEDSWLHYDHRLQIIPRDNVAVHQPLPTRAVNANGFAGDVDDEGGFRLGARGAPKPIIQQRGAPLVSAVLVGFAVRAGYAITPPGVTSIGGVGAVAMNDGSDSFSSWVAGNMGVPIIVATWSQRYVLEDVPALGVTAPDSPLYGTTGRDDNLRGTSMLDG